MIERNDVARKGGSRVTQASSTRKIHVRARGRQLVKRVHFSEAAVGEIAPS